jgi:hypothetical protein
MELKGKPRTPAQLATQAIERIYITMRHLFNRGYYKPMGLSGTTLREGLMQLQPEIYGSIAESKLELDGMLYVLDRLPMGIEECSIINLTSDEGYDQTAFQPIVPEKRRRNCYRIDAEQMNIEITRGRSDIYDVLTHLTFLFIESHKIGKHVQEQLEQGLTRDWEQLRAFVEQDVTTDVTIDVAIAHTANLVGRTFEEVKTTCLKFGDEQDSKRFLRIIYWLGKRALDEINEVNARSITFSAVLRERLGHHIHGEIWALTIKRKLRDINLLNRPIHIISANMHSVMNLLFAKQALGLTELSDNEVFEKLSQDAHKKLRSQVKKYTQKKGLYFLPDSSGTNIDVQIIDLAQVDLEDSYLAQYQGASKDVLIVMDYAFGEQAFETLDELLKQYREQDEIIAKLDVQSVSIMGKAGILCGDKGDIMIPNAHIFEGTADNYPFENELKASDFEQFHVVEGSMITVLGTSLQNKEMLKYFKQSTWRVVGLEMEGAHYQKAIQAASKIRKNICEQVKVRYAYYASDNPLETGKTLASGRLGLTGVKPTYAITCEILKQIISSSNP